MNNFFQGDEFYSFIKSVGTFTPFRCDVARDGVLKGRVQGYIQKDGGKIKQFFSRRAIVNGGILVEKDITESEVIDLLNKCKDTLKSSIYIEIRNYDDYSPFIDILSANGFIYKPHYNYHIITSSVDVVEANLGKSRKRDIRTSFRDGAAIDESPSMADIEHFYGLLDQLYRSKVKTPLFPIDFFKQLYRTSFGKYVLVKLDGKVIGGTVLVLGDGIVYEWFACGEDGKYKNIYPSTLATYGGIMYAAKNGYKRFDMMGAGAPGDGGYGVRDFKAKFGGELVEHGRLICVNRAWLYAIGCAVVKLMRNVI